MCVSVQVNLLTYFYLQFLIEVADTRLMFFYVNIVRTHIVSDFSERDFFLFVVIINIEINMRRKCKLRQSNVSQHEMATRKMVCEWNWPMWDKEKIARSPLMD